MLKKGVLYWCCTYGRLYNFTDHSAPKEKHLLFLKEEVRVLIWCKITPYDHPEIQRKSLQVIVPQQKKPQRFNDDGSQLPAFKTLMQKPSRLTKPTMVEAERYALQAQRLAPQAARPIYFWH